MYEIWRSRTSLNTFPRQRPDGTQSPVYEAGTPVGRIHSGVVNFKDISIGPEALETADGDINEDDRHSEDSTNKSAILLKPPKVPSRTKYVIILVGLPGRGKTFLCNKIKCYLNWLGHHTRHFNVGSYRRLQKGDHEVQNADFFDAHNPAGMEARHRALFAALDDLQAYLYSDIGQVAIFDATNTTEERRRLLIHRFHGRFQYLFIESICTDEKVLEQNYRFKMQYSPDYQGMEMHQSLTDFKERIHKYEEVYEPISDRNLHYIKLIDMVTGRGHMDVNRISGYLPGKIVFFLMQVCKAGMAQARRIWLTRHGQSEYNLLHRIGGNSSLAPAGEVYARCLPEMLIDRLPMHDDDQTCVPVSVWTSTLCRTIQTARYLPFPKLRWKALDEIQAGACDGLTYDEIAEQFPEEFAARQKDKLRYRYPAGESYLDVIQRLEPVIIEMEREKECIVVVGHQAVLRAVLGYFMAKPLESIPTLDVPLHTLVELRPRPDGTMDFDYVALAPEAAAAMEAAIAAGPPPPPSLGLQIQVGTFSSDSFSGVPSPMLSPVYSVHQRNEAALATARATAAAAVTKVTKETAAGGSVLEAAGTTAWSPTTKGSIASAAAAAAATTPVPPASTPPSASVVAVAAALGAAAEGLSEGPAAGSSPTISHHSRTPSLNSGMGGGGPPCVLGTSPSSGFHFTISRGSPGDTFGDSCGGASGVDSPSSRAAALAAAAAAESRTRKVRVPFGATVGGGGSEGGAPPEHVLAPPSAVSHSWSPGGRNLGSHGGGLGPAPPSGALDAADSATATAVAPLTQPQQQQQVHGGVGGGGGSRSVPEGDGGEHPGGGPVGVGVGVGVGLERLESEGIAAPREVSTLESSSLSLAYLLERSASLAAGGGGGGEATSRGGSSGGAGSGGGAGAAS
ncbi:hypothetical protein PLESTB_000596000 [Pleodorina starrii]|uniref:6-phosphofructo-2-kinase domain-containing protein n=1 Tax=Pleodorina starrii TaxID=330485 RepID=A0A9W6F1J0_9CHLO|nr:hypothetical protein PLESTM_001850800 [Pleodorina starrii]GLC52216.1 hypothetical protein PLESTB_000596000 [Pleodorina starrii]GLC67605.1 hypothetical protein PLESTF_000579800 [Pleodorina starrii]